MTILEEGKTEDFLGTEITLLNCNLFISMINYTEQLCELLELNQPSTRERITRPSKFPYFEDAQGDEPLNREGTALFLKAHGKIGWLANCLRCDLSYTYSMLAQSMQKPLAKHMAQVKHAARYLKGTSNFAFINRQDESFQENSWKFYTDTDHAGDVSPDTKRKSRFGYIATVNGFPVLWKSTTTGSGVCAHPKIDGNHAEDSSAGAEIFGASVATKAFMHLEYIVEEMNLAFPSPYTLHYDNQTAGNFIMGDIMNTKMKHIDIRQRWVQELRDRSIMIPQKIDTKKNLADLFTKGLQGEQLNRMTKSWHEGCETGVFVQLHLPKDDVKETKTSKQTSSKRRNKSAS